MTTNIRDFDRSNANCWTTAIKNVLARYHKDVVFQDVQVTIVGLSGEWRLTGKVYVSQTLTIPFALQASCYNKGKDYIVFSAVHTGSRDNKGLSHTIAADLEEAFNT